MNGWNKEKNVRWWTSDLHLSHERIIELCNRPFKNVEEMNSEIIRRWNSCVGFDDTVIIVGDICLGKISESLPLVTQLNGTKYLVPGNHDRVHPMHKKWDQWIDKYEEVGLNILSTELQKIPVGFNNEIQYMNVCHFPYYGDSQEIDRFVDFRPEDNGLPIIHGHIHSSLKINNKMIHVGVDAWNYFPVAESQIMELAKNLNT